MKQRQKVELLPGMVTTLVKELFKQMVPEQLIVRENPRTIIHRHTYGGISQFFGYLSIEILLGANCRNPDCDSKEIWLPPRAHCPDCWEEMRWRNVDTRGAKVYTHSTINLPGAGFMLTTPCPLISVEIPGVCTKFMSYLSEFSESEPYIGMPVRPVFRTEKPTYTILDVSWVPMD